MNRKDEYEKLLAELDTIPPELAHSVGRAKAKLKKTKNMRRMLVIPVSGLAVCLIFFTALVNISVPFAKACGRIPVLRKLAAAIAFSPSLSAAVENEYVQPINLEQSKNDITMRIEYVIADTKQLNIFYTMQSEKYSYLDTSVSLDSSLGMPDGGYGLSMSSPVGKSDELRQMTFDFISDAVPESLELKCRVYDRGGDVVEATAPPEQETARDQYEEPEIISEFSFALNFDPDYIQKCELIEMNRDFEIERQHFTVRSIEIYPTHIRLNLIEDTNNGKWITGLDFYLENEKGEKFEGIRNGITATGALDTKSMVSYRLESSFFSKSKKLTLFITGATLVEKETAGTKIDLVNATAENLPDGMKLENITKRGNNPMLVFSVPGQDRIFSRIPFDFEYFGEDGKLYNGFSEISAATSQGYLNDATGSYIETPGRYCFTMRLSDYHDDAVYLVPFVPVYFKLGEPIIFNVK